MPLKLIISDGNLFYFQFLNNCMLTIISSQPMHSEKHLGMSKNCQDTSGANNKYPVDVAALQQKGMQK